MSVVRIQELLLAASLYVLKTLKCDRFSGCVCGVRASVRACVIQCYHSYACTCSLLPYFLSLFLPPFVPPSLHLLFIFFLSLAVYPLSYAYKHTNTRTRTRTRTSTRTSTSTSTRTRTRTRTRTHTHTRTHAYIVISYCSVCFQTSKRSTNKVENKCQPST